MAIGLALGLGLALLASGALQPILFHVDPRDRTVFAAVAATLAFVSLVASLLPARRVTKIDPVLALASEQNADMRKTLLAVAALLVAAHLALHPRAASGIDGLWDATVVANGVEIPFRFEIATNGTDVQGSFFEGDRKVGSTSGRVADNVLTLDYDFLNTTLASRLRATN
jgi:Na+-transporting NADH:ubiquinone oxidoreductase subunit NqrC